MKSLIIGLLLLGTGGRALAQQTLFEAKRSPAETPGVLLQSVTDDFPGFSVTDIRAIPIEVVGEDVIVDEKSAPEDYDTYQLTLKGPDRELQALYQSDGTLISSYEYLENAAPPYAVRRTLAREFPGWTLTADTFRITQSGNKAPREKFRMVLTRNGQRKHVLTDADGAILKVS